MNELTLEALARRIEAIERQLAEQAAPRPLPGTDWRSVVGMFDDDAEFMQQVIAEGQAIRQAERDEAHKDRGE